MQPLGTTPDSLEFMNITKLFNALIGQRGGRVCILQILDFKPHSAIVSITKCKIDAMARYDDKEFWCWRALIAVQLSHMRKAYELPKSWQFKRKVLLQI